MKLRIFGALLGLLCVAGLVTAIFFVPVAWLKTPDPNASSIRVEIPDHATADAVGMALLDKGVISSRLGYDVYAWFDGAANMPRSGEYDLKPGMSYRTIARMLALGPARDEASFTAIEGWTIQDIQTALANKGVDVRPSDFLAERFADQYPFLKSLPPNTNLEGYLFPDTYRVWKDQLPDGLFMKQLDEFAKKTEGFAEEANAQGRDFRDVVILASIIEKEARNDEDRPIVAGIFLNRLKDGMRLQSDATLNYILKSGHDRLTTDELKNDSLYNSYQHDGLPPGPISNPGMASLEAALHPAKTDYRYFLTDPQGKTYYAKTLEEHQKNRAKAFGG